MSGCRYAVLIGNGAFGHDQPLLRPLRCSVHDVEGLSKVLVSDQHGAYIVTKILDATNDVVRRAIYQSLKRANRDDLVLIYYSGHGKLDDDGNLYLAAKDTAVDALPPTSIPVADIKKYAQDSLASKIVVILDCCFSGAVKKLYKGELADQASQAIRELEGQGTFYLTASTDIQLAEEKEGDEYSLLTKHLISGIREGSADLNDDGLISFHELCSYVQSQVPREGSQRPRSWSLDAAGDVTVALSGKPAYDARCRAITKKLYELANQDLLTDDTVVSLLEIIKQQTANRSRVDNLAVKSLIDSLYSKLNSTGAFVQGVLQWTLKQSVPTTSVPNTAVYQGSFTNLNAKEGESVHVSNPDSFKGLRRISILSVVAIIVLCSAFIVARRYPQSSSSPNNADTKLSQQTRVQIVKEDETPPPNPLTMSIPSTRPWTPTGITLQKGQFITISASGEIIVSDHNPPQTPNGTGKACYPNPEIHYWHFPAQNLSCSSLIGKIGDLTPFEVGSSKQFRAESSGPLWLGVNDNWFPDNHGNWEVTISVKDEKSQ